MVKTLPFPIAIKTLTLPELDRNLFSSADWILVIDHTYRLRIFVKYIEEEGRVLSYIIYTVVHNFLEDKICICSYCDYCDCHVTSPLHWQELFDTLKKEYPMYRITVRNLRDEIVRQNPNFQQLSKERFHLLDVRSDLDVIWKKTHDSFKSAVKQAQKSGVVVRSCLKEDLKRFYDLHLKVRKNKYHLFPQPYQFFDNIWHQYMEHDQGILLGAFDRDNRMIGANIYLMCGNMLYYKFNTSQIRALSLRPNNILFWEGIKFAKSRKLEFMDLGSSGWEQDGLILFKNHTGAQMSEIMHLGFTPPDYQFSNKIILKILTRFFTNRWMPDIFLRWGSRWIYPYLA